MNKSLFELVEAGLCSNANVKNAERVGKFAYLLELEGNNKAVARVLPRSDFNLKSVQKLCESYPGVFPNIISVLSTEKDDIIVQEYISGASIADLIREGRGSEEALLVEVVKLFDHFNALTTESNEHNYVEEIDSLRAEFSCYVSDYPIDFSEVYHFFDHLRLGARELVKHRRYSCGDFISSNIIRGDNGLMIADVDFAELTHFYHGEILRLDVFGGLKKKLFQEIVPLDGSDRELVRIWFWIKQAILESKLYGRPKALTCALNDLSKLPFSQFAPRTRVPVSFAIAEYLRDVELVEKDQEALKREAEFAREVRRIGTERDALLSAQAEAYNAEIERIAKERENLLLDQARAFDREVARISKERDQLLESQERAFRTEIARLVEERDRLLLQKDEIYEAEIVRIGLERDVIVESHQKAFRRELARLIEERENLLREKDELYRAEILRIGRERDVLLAEKDRAYLAEISRIGQERDVLLAEKDRAYQSEILRISNERDCLLASKEKERQDELEKNAHYVQVKLATLAERSEKQHAALRSEHQRLVHQMRKLYSSVLPEVTIVIVDFDGHEYLRRLFDALLKQLYGSFRVLLVLNGEMSESRGIAEHYSQFLKIDLIDNATNRGFSGGNNDAFKRVKTQFVVLLNNDTVPETDWLLHLYRRISSDPRIAGVCSKVLFDSSYVEIEVLSDSFRPVEEGDSDDERLLGVMLRFEDGNGKCLKAIVKDGVHSPEKIDGQDWAWTNGKARIWIPVADGGTVRIRYRSHRSLLGSHLRLNCRGETMCSLLEDAPTSVDLPASWLSTRFDVINNAGSFIRNGWEVGDIGINEADDGNYDRSVVVSAVCACSLILRKSAVGKTLFPDDFFAYFEDTDLSARLRKAGYILMYEPMSRVRHVHSGSSGEGSPFFRYHVYRNYRWLLVRNLESYREIFALFVKEIREYALQVGGLEDIYASRQLKNDTLRGMLRNLLQRILGRE